MVMLLLFFKLRLSCFQIQYLFIIQHKQKSNTLKEELRYGSKPASTGKPQCGGFVKKSSDDQKVSCHFLSSVIFIMITGWFVQHKSDRL